ncbi:MAG: energy-coupled thiamine transporter ThiT [Ruminococcaceae bacterium]|nr:energy-coupled thiamine transporter ThiT [Oscillospiraceae bacterium]
MNSKLSNITRSAVMIALAATLSFFKILEFGNGGSVTMGSMVPVILVSFMLEFKWGVITSFVYSLLQMLLQGIAAPPVESFFWYFLVILLDYILAFTVLGFAGYITSGIRNKRIRIIFGTVTVVLMRFICHLLSGIIIWGVYAPEGQSVLVYSLLYNGSYMLGELIVTVIVMLFISNIKYFDNMIK